MYDSRFDKLADVLTSHSTRVTPGDTVMIEAIDIPDGMVVALMRSIRGAGGRPMVSMKASRVMRELIKNTDEETMKLAGANEKSRMEKANCYIGMRGSRNISEMSDVSAEQMHIYEEHWVRPVHFDVRVNKTRWVVLRWPTHSMAQNARRSTEGFEDFYFDVCTLDYTKMEKAARPLQELMAKTDHVKIVGNGTDLTFSIKDIPVVACTGSHNIPDGECFTAPVRDSVNGTIRYNAATIYRGTVFDEVILHFTDGKVTGAEGNNADRLNEILDTDEGARYVGEFAIGFNPYIHQPMLDILFDEKIAGSFHFTPGQAYATADNGNRSNIHWDMVVIQTPEYGGGEIYFDDRLIRKDGHFVVPELEALNPDALK